MDTLEELSRAALDAPMLPSPTQKTPVFAPFGGFSWNGDECPDGWLPKPVGASKTEARDVAWLMTCSARAASPNTVAVTASALAYATHLRREGVVATAMYKRLAERVDELVPISELESELKCKWGEVDICVDGVVRRMDPYFWTMLETVVKDSVFQYLQTLEVSLCCLKGLEPLQKSAQIGTAMDRVRTATWHELSRALLAGASSAQVVAALEKLRDSFVEEHVGIVKTHMRSQIKWLRSLSWLCASEMADFEQNLLSVDHDVASLLRQPPGDFSELLAAKRVSLRELASVYGGDGFLGGSSRVPPPSFGVKASIVWRWLHRSKHAISEACVASIGTMRRLVQEPVKAPCWSGVELCRADASDPRARRFLDDPRAVVDGLARSWVPPPHLGCVAGEERLLVAHATNTASCVRCNRFFSVLISQTQLGLLPSRTLCAGELLPLVSRFTAEGDVHYAQLVDMKLRPLADACETPWPEDTTAAGQKRPMPNSPASSDEGSAPPPIVQAVPVVNGTAPAQQVQQANVPSSLMRDHAILFALCKCIREDAEKYNATAPWTHRVGMDRVCAMVRAVAPSLNSQSDPSLKQAVSWCCKEVVVRATKERENDSATVEFDYLNERDRKAGGQVVGVVFTTLGRSTLLRYVSWVVARMAFDGVAYEREWKPTRSSLCHGTKVSRVISSAPEVKRPKSASVVSAVRVA